MITKNTFLSLFFTVVYFSHFSQDTIKDRESNFKLEGMLMVSYNKQFIAFSVGGPSLMFKLNKSIKIGFGAFPSFYIKEGKTGAKLGVSPRIDINNFSIVSPFYHFDSSGKWYSTFGLAYKFNHHKK